MNSLETIESKASDAASRVAGLLQRHPRSVMAAVLLVLLGSGATVFAVAPLVGPDPALMPKRLVTENVSPAPLGEQLDALASHELDLYRSDLTRSSDTADTLLRRMGVDDVGAAAFLRTNKTAAKLLDGHAGKMVQVRTRADGDLEELVARYPAEKASQLGTHFTRLSITHSGSTFEARLETVPMSSETRLGGGTIQSTLFAAIDDAQLPDAIGGQLAEMFSTEIDFHRELKRGDSFTVMYQALTADGEPISWSQGREGVGRVLAAEFVHEGKAHASVWFEGSSGKGNYFALDGASKHRSFLASPLEFSRMTSGFSMRLHPILQTWRQHAGVDYAAPMGTPVRSVGDGVVSFAGWQNGYGNVVEIMHDKERETRYAHLSRIDVRTGEHVEQSERIGAVGMTGWATGPHLHFEFRVAGAVHDPTTIAQATDSMTIAPVDRARFAALAASARAQLAAADSATQVGLGD